MACLFTRSLIRRRLLNQLFVFRSSLFLPCCPIVKPLMLPDFMERKSSSISRFFSSRSLDLDDKQGPAVIDYSSLLQEDEFHRLADATLNDLQEKLEEYGDSVQIDAYDVDYGNQVLTVKLGTLGTYVLNKQTPNRQIWLSSPISGPFRFDWDQSSQTWVYRRTKASLLPLLEIELESLCGEPIKLS
ncbi:frataxin, mitochondrial [Aristolochia californica]|uniref:frataxin, mitochondrial n=1 Tax=Aristolochia californica TaxID=171875 RepID=UPI0035E14756